MNELATRSGWEMTPSDSKEAMAMAQWIAESGLVPDSFKGKPKDICVTAAMGSKLGLDVFSSMQGIAVVNGRPSLWGDVLRGLIVGRADLTDLVEKFEGEGDSLTAVCIITRGKRSPYEARFSVADAKSAGLWGKNVWAKFSNDMLVNRAFSRGARRAFADVLSGVNVAEEMIDAEIVKDVEATVHEDKPPFKEEAPAKPKRAKTRVTATEVVAEEKDIAGQEVMPEVIKSDKPGNDPHKNEENFISNTADTPTSVGVTYDVLMQMYKEAVNIAPDAVKASVDKHAGIENASIDAVPENKWQRCWDDMADIVEYM